MARKKKDKANKAEAKKTVDPIKDEDLIDPRIDPNYDYRADLESVAIRKKRAKWWIGVFSTLIAVFIIISFLGYLVAQEQASAASVRLTNRAKEIELAQIGFRLESPLTVHEQETYNLKPDARNAEVDKKVYWTTTRISQKTFEFVISKSGFPEGLTLSPVTSRAFKANDELRLYNSYDGLPIDERHFVSTTEASHFDYFGFDILFKITLKNNNESLAGFPFYFDASSQFRGYNAIDRAIRFGFTSDYTSDIIRPVPYIKNNETEGSIAVGGRYDFLHKQTPPQGYNNDEFYKYSYYDYTEFKDSDGKQYEIAFGDFTEVLTDEFWEDTPASVNDLPGPKTAPGIYAFKDDKATPLRAYFKNSFRHYSYINKVGQYIAVTNEEGIAELDVKIWLEGWDPAATNDVDGINFEADIGFEVRDKLEN